MFVHQELIYITDNADRVHQALLHQLINQAAIVQVVTVSILKLQLAISSTTVQLVSSQVGQTVSALLAQSSLTDNAEHAQLVQDLTQLNLHAHAIDLIKLMILPIIDVTHKLFAHLDMFFKVETVSAMVMLLTGSVSHAHQIL